MFESPAVSHWLFVRRRKWPAPWGQNLKYFAIGVLALAATTGVACGERTPNPESTEGHRWTA